MDCGLIGGCIMENRELVFLCYAHENLKQVLKVYEGLEKRKVNVWIDKKGLK
jgi:hypothetical protein